MKSGLLKDFSCSSKFPLSPKLNENGYFGIILHRVQIGEESTFLKRLLALQANVFRTLIFAKLLFMTFERKFEPLQAKNLKMHEFDFVTSFGASSMVHGANRIQIYPSFHSFAFWRALKLVCAPVLKRLSPQILRILISCFFRKIICICF